MANERHRCMEIALGIWKKKPAKDAEWYKTVGREIVAEIWGFDYILPSGIPVVVDQSLEEDEWYLLSPPPKGRKLMDYKEKILAEILKRSFKNVLTQPRLVYFSHVKEIILATMPSETDIAKGSWEKYECYVIGCGRDGAKPEDYKDWLEEAE